MFETVSHTGESRRRTARPCWRLGSFSCGSSLFRVGSKVELAGDQVGDIRYLDEAADSLEDAVTHLALEGTGETRAYVRMWS